MTETMILDPADPNLVFGATGLLQTFNAAGVLGPADVHAATAIARLAGEADDRVRLALALTVRAVRAGSVCIDLAEVHTTSFDTSEVRIDLAGLPWPEPAAWLEAVRASPMVADGHDHEGGRPLRLAHGLLYLERYWLQEEEVRTEWLSREERNPPELDRDRLTGALDRLFTGEGLPAGEPDQQRRAAAVAALRWVSVIAGGPGTGKTTTVARVLALLLDQPGLDHRPGRGLRIALAAPTGKAAARLEEAVREAADQLPAADRDRLGELSASTLHRLLGWLPGSRGRFRYHRGNHLPYDVIVVDETSMVSLTLMARLLEAVRPDARLVFVGDPDQLSSVEAGAVLADIATAPGPDDTALDRGLAALGLDSEPAPPHGVVRLSHTWRYGGAIETLARAIRDSDADAAIDVLRSGAEDVIFVESDLDRADPAGLEPLRERVLTAGRTSHDAAAAGDVEGALRGLDQHRLLCAHRQGPYGVARWGAEAEHWLIEAYGSWAVPAAPGSPVSGRDRTAEWYPGRPLLITANDYELGLYNGDTGVVVATEHGPRAAFARGAEPTVVSPVRLDAVQTVHAMTVHRAQGSQFGCVSFIVPPPDSPLLTRELLYTAVTRATDRVQVFGTVDAIRRAVLHPANRASGLRPRLRPASSGS
ncbi:exodeoxyribonuclease V subunit alpha [Microlunatus parietis]|uniref:RecBCD enzyme subunit RecD n=1 Tax=Microlunatus parietis TaxID=682979 RepID=A0A7Y9IEI2_9ACTN|nr:exodeoxyribonuclease V subunit alpha [Microlunatus parietis]NYE75262.1 exodeoxyribonuclease V alpha subunit [Microlunatus parietis]